MQVMILAAGMGRRLHKYTSDRTKCMVEVNGTMLIDRTIESIRQAGIKKVVMVVGYNGKDLEDHLKQNIRDIEFKFVYNEEYESTNNIFSLYLAKEELVKDDTILMESDIIFDLNLIRDIYLDENENLVTVAKYEQWMDGTVVRIDKENTIVDFVNKSEFRFSDADTYYKTVNIYKFDKEFLRTQYLPFLEAYIKAYGVHQYYEAVLKILAHVHESQMHAFVLEDYNWYEIDDEQDLKIASTIFSDKEHKFEAYDGNYGGFWRFPKLKDFCYLVNPYYPPPKMLDHIRYFSDTLIREYPSGLATQNMNAGRMFNISSDHILVGNGAAELINVLGNTMDGRILATIPVFNEYIRCFRNADFEFIRSEESDYCVEIKEIKKHINAVDVVTLVNPDNPSGMFYAKEEVIELIEYCKEQKKRIIIDESFIDFADPERRYTLISDEILEKYPNLIVVKSISKSYGVPGLRLGILSTSDTILLDNMRQQMAIWNINSFAEYFLQIHGIYEKTYYLACDNIAYQRNKILTELKNNKFLKVYPSQANYIMCKLKGEMDSKQLANVLVKNHNILIKDLSGKDGVSGTNYIRVAVKDEKDNKELIAAINKELK